jgi:hypothetical protein
MSKRSNKTYRLNNNRTKVTHLTIKSGGPTLESNMIGHFENIQIIILLCMKLLLNLLKKQILSITKSLELIICIAHNLR